MINLLSYSGINTKVKAMTANLISKDEFNKIADFDMVFDFIAFLKYHPGYREIFSRYDEHELHRGDVERIINNGLYLDYTKIYRFADDAQRKDLELIFLRYEVNIIKACIRLVYNDKNMLDVSHFQYFFKKHSNIMLEALLGSKTIEEFITNLKGTDYYPLLEKLHSSSNPAFFDYEMQLDIHYYKKIWKLKDKLLNGDTLKAFTECAGTEIDLLNIMWIYRSKSIYDLNHAAVLSIIIPISYKLSKEQLAKLAASSTIEEYMNILKNSYYREMYTSFQNGTMENSYQNMMNKMYKLSQGKYPNSMATVNAYLHYKELETSRLTTALECIRYKLDAKNKLRYMLQ
jgi:V/A-type H+-transporting ATPase subunit C